MAMKLHFKKNAIVRFALICEANLNACGSVIEVSDTEVVFIPQEYVSKYDYNESIGTSELDRTISVDWLPEVHLDRSIIAMWSYEPVPCRADTIYRGVLQPSEIVEQQIAVNEYNDDGLCMGHGDFFE